MLSSVCSAEITGQAGALAALKSEAPKDRLEAIQYLGAQRSDDAYAALALHFRQEKDAYLRVQLVEALDVTISTWSAACALEAADDGNLAVRAAAAVALAPLSGGEAADAKLSALAADPADSVRLAVVSSSARNPGPSTETLLGSVLGDKAAALPVRREAAGALAGMKSKKADAELLKYLSDPDPVIKKAAASRKPAPRPAARKKKAPAKTKK